MQDIVSLKEEEQGLIESIPSSLSIHWIRLDLRYLRQAIKKEWANVVVSETLNRINSVSGNLVKQQDEILSSLVTPSQSIEDVFGVKQFLKTLPQTLDNLIESVKSILAFSGMFEEISVEIPEDFRENQWSVVKKHLQIINAISVKQDELKADEIQFLKLLKNEQESFVERCQQLKNVVKDFKQKADPYQLNDTYTESLNIAVEIDDCIKTAQVINNREKIFSLAQTDFSEVNLLNKDFESYKGFWSSLYSWKKLSNDIMNGPFRLIDTEALDKSLSEINKQITKCSKAFAENPTYFKVLNEFKEDIDKLKSPIQLVQGLRNPGIKERHWKKISDEAQIPDLNSVLETADFTLKKLLDIGLGSKVELISKISDIAAKEFSIESALDKMKTEWDNIFLEVIPYRTEGSYVCKIPEEIFRQIEDHVTMTQSIAFSPFKAAFKERLSAWDTQIRLLQETTEALVETQKQWLYLEPIFSSDDIMQQLPQEGKKFSSIDKSFKRFMLDSIREKQTFVQLLSNKKILDIFSDSIKGLEQIGKSLTAYLDSKRVAFPRFFFLSDDELLQIISQSNNPEAVQPHLAKCFESISSLKMKDTKIEAMLSSVGEVVSFSEECYARGNVETWLLDVEDVMKKSIASVLAESIVAYQKLPRSEWVKKWPGQIVIAGSQVYWTKEVSEAISTGTLKDLLPKLDRQLQELVSLVRLDLTRLLRMILSDLIVIDVHARDVVQKLIDADVKSTDHFDFMSQLRYYFQEKDLYVKILNASFLYGYEYLGNTGRLVITNLTDRCYLTLTMAINLNMGGAPAGPAGTGKTETTKDLAKALAKQCVASSGAWACFDEFNRIDIEVLSVVAQQISTIQRAVIQKLTKFVFEGTEIKLDPACAVFITMNPGYAGRSELPDNLKALFRPVAMMIPDYRMIAEISLFSFGFSNARPLAQKLVAAFKLSSEVLSSQDHYDFGMRAVKAVISSAGNLRRQYPDALEEALLLRALKECNIPKFLANDVPLFNGILSDLFPSVDDQKVDNENLMTALKDACKELNLQPTDVFLWKCIQLYETTVVRHGLMLVGPSGAKTSCYKTLGKALTNLNGQFPERFNAVQIFVLNPKSITSGQLYGEFDAQTHEWSDGIVPCLVRNGVADTSPDSKWYIFDGPVDAIWIESMNTVLDDNKKLCLTSGEIIKLKDSQKMIFEVDNLAHASPATVSRCGMVYVEPVSIGIQPLIVSWLHKEKEVYSKTENSGRDEFYNNLSDLLGTRTSNLIDFVINMPKLPLSLSIFGLIKSLLNILSALISKVAPEVKIQPFDLYIFSLFWSIGAVLNSKQRKDFNDKVLQIFAIEFRGHFLSDLLIYDYCYDLNSGKWSSWSAGTASSSGEESSLVSTMDTIRYGYWLNILSSYGAHMMLVGYTGTAKTTMTIDYLNYIASQTNLSIVLNFSARTTASQVQQFLDSKFSKRRKGVFGPPIGSKLIVFIDDLNMPSAESTGTQPPIELIRQVVDQGGWYDRQNVGKFLELQDLTFIAAMNPPSTGRQPTSPRLLRNFNIFFLPEVEEPSMMKIYTEVFNSFIKKNSISFSSESAASLVTSSVKLYTKIKSELLPTPLKAHYVYNLRDLSKVFKGIQGADVTRLNNEIDVIKLWIHEMTRVFQDRLTESQDRAWFLDTLFSLINQNFKNSKDPSFEIIKEPVFFCNFVKKDSNLNSYQEVKDVRSLAKPLEDYLDDYNNSRNSNMKIVFFFDAIEHLIRVSRIIKDSAGNALLLGVGGSGRQSLSKLATFIQDIQLFQIEVSKNYGLNEWREDMKKLLMMTGVDGKSVVFLFSDTQIINEGCLEDINSLLNGGYIPGLFKQDELEKIMSSMRTLVQQMGIPIKNKETLFNLFPQRVRKHLRVILCMSPIGEIFRVRLRMFPSLLSCCSIDYYSQWPREALCSVAAQAISEIPNVGSEEQVEGLLQVCALVHESVRESCKDYKSKLGRFNYVTPKTYLGFMGAFRKLLALKRKELQGSKKRMQSGLEKLLAASREVAQLQEDLKEMQPRLIKASEETEETMKNIDRDKAQAEKIREVIAVEEKAAAKKAEETQLIKDDAERDLAEALPALEAALESLKLLTKNDIIEVRSMQRPPEGVKLVIEAICIMKQVKPKKIEGEKGKKIDDYWENGKSLLADPGKFLESLTTFDKDNISEQTIQKIKPYIESEDFTPAAISRVSKAATSLCMWVRAMEKYFHVSKSVAPKRARLQEAEAVLEDTLKNLRELKVKILETEESIKEMERQYAESLATKEELGKKVEECNVKLSRAGKLIVGLADERERWSETIKDIDLKNITMIGDSLICSAIVAYFGPFTAEFRSELLKVWFSQLEKAKIKVSTLSNSVLLETFGDPLIIRQWEVNGLPKDNLSRENGTISYLSSLWPLFIDPQGQANKWIKNKEKENALDVVKQTQKDFLRTLENCIRFGRPCLLENVAETLDPALEPVLLKQTFKQGNNTLIKLGENILPFHDDFKLYITTKLSNPVFTPELLAKVSVINFTLASNGLEDQLLSSVIISERPDLEETKNTLVVNNSKMKVELKEIEDKILYLLSSVQGSPVDDERLIETLSQSKKTSTEIKEKMAVAEKTEKEIDKTRLLYLPVAKRASILYFSICELATIESMYQYSLEWFSQLFKQALADSEASDLVSKRIQIISDYFTFSLYKNVSRSLFEKHKLMFAFFICYRILKEEEIIDDENWRYLVTSIPSGSTKTKEASEEVIKSWMPKNRFDDLKSLSCLDSFSIPINALIKNPSLLKSYYEDLHPENLEFPQNISMGLPDFQKLLLLKALRPDRLTFAIQKFVGKSLGNQYVEPVAGDLLALYKESSNKIPIVFILSSGVDPAQNFYKLADDLRMSRKTAAISLGQGQGPKAEALIREGMEQGMWILLQNCHLCPSWMPSLERILENTVSEKIHKDFRLWLTSMPTSKFPASILQNSVKMTLEPPKGVRANLMRTYSNITELELNDCNKVEVWKKLLFSISLFHAVIIERKRFGPLGWNIPYEFTDGDFQVCMKQLHRFLEEQDEVPYKVLKYVSAHIFYGGRITDEMDRRLIENLTEDYYNERVLQDDYHFSPSNVFYSVATGNLEEYRQFIKNLPMEEPIELFNLDSNANLALAESEAASLFECLSSILPKSSTGGGGSTREQQLINLVESIYKKIPAPFDIRSIASRYPQQYQDSMPIVLIQECERFNKLLDIIRQSLLDAEKALKGLSVLSEPLEVLCNQLFLNVVPTAWSARSYPSLKPLSSWVVDLLARVEFFNEWATKGTPTSFWLPGFFFPQAFLTAVLQNHARKHSIPVNMLSFDFKVVSKSETTTKPENGCYVYGLFLEGSRWNSEKQCLDVSLPGESTSEVPPILFLPTNLKTENVNKYNCPLYKTLIRAGSLSTTGHSTNYILSVSFNSREPESFWIKRGTALFCSLKF